MSKKHKKIIQFGIILSTNLFWFFLVSGCVSISAFVLAGIHIVITISAIELKICVITAGIKKYKSIIKKEKKKHDKIVLLAKSKLNIGEFLTSKALIDEFALTNDMLRGFYHMKEEN